MTRRRRAASRPDPGGVIARVASTSRGSGNDRPNRADHAFSSSNQPTAFGSSYATRKSETSGASRSGSRVTISSMAP